MSAILEEVRRDCRRSRGKEDSKTDTLTTLEAVMPKAVSVGPSVQKDTSDHKMVPDTQLTALPLASAAACFCFNLVALR